MCRIVIYLSEIAILSTSLYSHTTYEVVAVSHSIVYFNALMLEDLLL